MMNGQSRNTGKHWAHDAWRTQTKTESQYIVCASSASVSLSSIPNTYTNIKQSQKNLWKH